MPQSGGLARSSSSLSGELQLSPSGSGTVPSISRLGSIAAGPPQLNKLAPAVGLGAARRSADLPLQQLMGMQTPGALCPTFTASLRGPVLHRRALQLLLMKTMMTVIAQPNLRISHAQWCEESSRAGLGNCSRMRRVLERLHQPFQLTGFHGLNSCLPFAHTKANTSHQTGCFVEALSTYSVAEQLPALSPEQNPPLRPPL